MVKKGSALLHSTHLHVFLLSFLFSSATTMKDKPLPSSQFVGLQQVGNSCSKPCIFSLDVIGFGMRITWPVRPCVV